MDFWMIHIFITLFLISATIIELVSNREIRKDPFAVITVLILSCIPFVNYTVALAILLYWKDLFIIFWKERNEID